MLVLVACEESQAVTTHLRELGHEAYSCDISMPSGGHPEWHIRGDVMGLLNGKVNFRTLDDTLHRMGGGMGHDHRFPALHLSDECRGKQIVP